ncbi:hypothetical protein BDK51DRAFT_29598 [Blyttiomyces helicus]|uniref:Uncharacterized protein n=1 Tax=Blyttiomyces helicus TaxID=388810 RepID=A0A4P9WDL8_9FUNG|nr:hypothetical protein BDK51DRAFT_29598 [Blyttiomyces helicus]|eukprot:RKO90799.1 hypothetical protein BDK51DRAFT_29598 [Blyttiomyces helicus]
MGLVFSMRHGHFWIFLKVFVFPDKKSGPVVQALRENCPKNFPLAVPGANNKLKLIDWEHNTMQNGMGVKAVHVRLLSTQSGCAIQRPNCNFKNSLQGITAPTRCKCAVSHRLWQGARLDVPQQLHLSAYWTTTEDKPPVLPPPPTHTHGLGQALLPLQIF